MSKMPGKKFYSWGRLAPLGVSVLIMWVIFRRIDLEALSREFLHVRTRWFIVAFLLFGFCSAMAALRLHLILRQNGCAVHLGATFRVVFIGHFFNSLMFGPAAGDVAKSALYNRWFRHSTTMLLGSSYLDRLCGGVGMCFFIILVLSVGLAGGMFSTIQGIQIRLPEWWVFVALGVVLLIVALAFRYLLRGGSFLAQTRDALLAGYRRLKSNPKLAAKGIFLGFLVQGFWSGVLAFNLQAVTQAPIPWSSLLWTFPVIMILAAIPITVSGAGLREGSALVILGLYGVPATDAVAASMLTFLTYMLWAIIGGLLLWREERLFKRHRGRRPPGTISVVIPALNEADNLTETITHAKRIPEVCEMLVVDGGSTDATRQVAESLGCRVILSEPGRGSQLRRGAALASGDVVLLLHADTWLPAGAGRAVLDCLRDVTVVAGGFWKRFRNPSWVMAGSRFRCGVRLYAFGRLMGDQAMFIRREALAAAGGVPDVPLMEEFEMCKRLRKHGRLALAAGTVSTSARRFTKHGPLRTYWRMWRVTLQYILGAKPHELRRIYEKE